ncbi:ASCH domain-containing protein [Variovorax ginsengisoli]|uniref:ASCH domain-containing protein n=1 Tax=Variovorax ginsengisoli TaxID=363844 RepID=A0ABT9SFR9_9BURK|nr:ASCH domain-containing protein [Variovorax ginsengisoli]MDP9902641.1 hypothetical protein [Variovorax ginsengisoli]
MKAVTICQPYPRLIMIGVKHAENRTWSTRYRGPLAIHAGKSRLYLVDDDETEAIESGGPLVFGAVVALCTLAGCVHVSQIHCGMLDEQFPQLRDRAHCYGPFCWVLTDVRRLVTPLPWRGAQGLFDIPDDVLGAVDLEAPR